jgi:hypothetical protein
VWEGLGHTYAQRCVHGSEFGLAGHACHGVDGCRLHTPLHRRYDAAVRRGDGAVIVEQSEDSADVFKASVGALLAGHSVDVCIAYVSEVAVEGRDLRFVVPTAVAPRYPLSAAEAAIPCNQGEACVYPECPLSHPGRRSGVVGVAGVCVCAWLSVCYPLTLSLPLPTPSPPRFSMAGIPSLYCCCHGRQ